MFQNEVAGQCQKFTYKCYTITARRKVDLYLIYAHLQREAYRNENVSASRQNDIDDNHIGASHGLWDSES